jgi:hypothetical protein
MGFITSWWLTYPSDKWSSSVGIMTFSTEWKNDPNVSNHQPDQVSLIDGMIHVY